MAVYFQGFGEKGHSFSGIWGESITFWGFREQGDEEKHFRELGRIQGAGSKGPRYNISIDSTCRDVFRCISATVFVKGAGINVKLSLCRIIIMQS